MIRVLTIAAALAAPLAAHAAEPAAILIKPAAVWTATEDRPHAGWVVLVRGNRISAAR